MTILVCALLSAAAFYFSIGLGDQWWLAWIAPVPILWLAFGDTKTWAVFFAAWAAYALGEMNLLRAYAGTLPVAVLMLAVAGPALIFALATLGARQVRSAIGPVAAMVAFAAVWAALDFLSSFNHVGGSVSTPAAAESGAPLLIQTASLVGFTGITFLLGIVSAGLALGLRTRDSLPAGIAIAFFCANLGFGYWRMSSPPSSSIRVALIASDNSVGNTRTDDKVATLQVIDAYTAEVVKLRDAHIGLIVLPENISRVSPAWRREAEAKLATAAEQTHATLVAGFNTNLEQAQHNVSWAFTPGESEPVTYEKRQLVPILETTVFVPGSGPKVLPNGTGLEICKDMDFQAMIRADAAATKPLLLAVPAWDFHQDAWSHTRVAVLRSVENGVPMARSARAGLLTLNDRYGRLVAVTATAAGFQTLIGELPLDGRGGETLYDRIGDAFGWLCLALGIGLVGFSLARKQGR